MLTRIGLFQRTLLPSVAVFLFLAVPQPCPAAEQERTTSTGLKLVLIPAGEFQMGGQESAEHLFEAFRAYKRGPEYFQDEYPRHRVRITRPFYLGKYEVTVGQLRRFEADSGYRTEAEKDGKGGWGYNPETHVCEGRRTKFTWKNPGFPQTEDHPVVNVTWRDAVAFCDWMSRKEGKRFRLPTEAEWEYSCRAGSTTRYYNGNDPAGLPEIAQVLDARGRTSFPSVDLVTIPPDQPNAFTSPVGKRKPNAFGLYDMHGNAWEWCQDRYDVHYYSHSPLNDPTGPETGRLRVRRGGGWNSFPLWARASFRNWNTPWSRCVNLGFRVVCEIPLDPGSKSSSPPSESRSSGR